jgi:TRAP-type C4-dicarboxylate transport system permease small subunit
MLAGVERFAGRVAYWTGIAVMIFVAAFTMLVFVSVVLRYGFSQGLEWSEELGRYLMIWMGFLAASLALRSGAHVGIDLVCQLLPPTVRRVVILASSAAVFCFFAMVVYQGSVLLILVRPKPSLVLPVSMFWPYLAIPVGSLLMLIQLIPLAVREWTTGSSKPVREDELKVLSLD